VACCVMCAGRAFPEDVPSKEDWMRREWIADHSYIALQNPPSRKHGKVLPPVRPPLPPPELLKIE